MSIFSFTSSGGTPTANEHSPRPSSPTCRWPSSELVAPQIGGCGCWIGFGCTRRGGIDQCSPSNSYSSLVQQPTTWPIASCHIAARLGRVDAEALELGPGGGAAGAEVDPPVGDEVEHGDRLGGAHRVVVRLRHEPHAEAEPHPLGLRGDGAVEHLGVRAVRVLLEEVVLHGPERVPAVAFAGHRLLDRVLVGEALGVGTPRPGDGDLVEQGEAHGARCTGQRRGRRTRWHGVDGKVVIVTGAASGIGRATARRLLADGATVVGADLADDGRRPRRAVDLRAAPTSPTRRAVQALVAAGGRRRRRSHRRHGDRGRASPAAGRRTWSRRPSGSG